MKTRVSLRYFVSYCRHNLPKGNSVEIKYEAYILYLDEYSDIGPTGLLCTYKIMMLLILIASE